MFMPRVPASGRVRNRGVAAIAGAAGTPIVTPSRSRAATMARTVRVVGRETAGAGSVQGAPRCGTAQERT